jgi:uncharacterized protein
MEKIQLYVLGLSASPATNNAYALILKEMHGKRRLPIIIGAFEAQAIALELEGVIPPRPMTHDLMKSFLESFDVILTEVYINELKEGTFYAKLVFDDLNIDIDARPSDAIALAVRCNAPIYVNSDVMDETGVFPQGDEGDFDREDAQDNTLTENFGAAQTSQTHKPKTRIEQLQGLLDKAVKDENYEQAAQLRDEIKKITESS